MKKLFFICISYLTCFHFAQGSSSKGPIHSEKRLMLTVVPGKSLGGVSIGDSKAVIIEKGFVSDQDRDPEQYFVKGLFLVRIEGPRVNQIWFNGNAQNLYLRDKKIPKSKDLKILRSFFKNCESEILGSAGKIVYCENRGVELIFSFEGKLQGLSIVTPSLVESTVNPKK